LGWRYDATEEGDNDPARVSEFVPWKASSFSTPVRARVPGLEQGDDGSRDSQYEMDLEHAMRLARRLEALQGADGDGQQNHQLQQSLLLSMDSGIQTELVSSTRCATKPSKKSSSGAIGRGVPGPDRLFSAPRFATAIFRLLFCAAATW
jgi:hypothetical protein